MGNLISLQTRALYSWLNELHFLPVLEVLFRVSWHGHIWTRGGISGEDLNMSSVSTGLSVPTPRSNHHNFQDPLRPLCWGRGHKIEDTQWKKSSRGTVKFSSWARRFLGKGVKGARGWREEKCTIRESETRGTTGGLKCCTWFPRDWSCSTLFQIWAHPYNIDGHWRRLENMKTWRRSLYSRDEADVSSFFPPSFNIPHPS